jgi:hypothetical protein
VDFIRFHGKRHPRELGVGEIRAYLSYLPTEKDVAASTENVALSALLFLYRRVLRVELPNVENIERARRSKRIPVVFTSAEVEAILTQLAGTHHLVIGLPCPAIIYASYFAPTTLMRGLAEAKPIRQTHLRWCGRISSKNSKVMR